MAQWHNGSMANQSYLLYRYAFAPLSLYASNNWYGFCVYLKNIL